MDNLSYALLDEDAVKMGLASLADWSIENNILTKTYSFESYAEGIMFGAAVGHLATSVVVGDGPARAEPSLAARHTCESIRRVGLALLANARRVARNTRPRGRLG